MPYPLSNTDGMDYSARSAEELDEMAENLLRLSPSPRDPPRSAGRLDKQERHEWHEWKLDTGRQRHRVAPAKEEIVTTPTSQSDFQFFPNEYDPSQSPKSYRGPPIRKNSRASERRPSHATSYSLYPPSNPPLTKPLPPLPLPVLNGAPSQRVSSAGSIAASDVVSSVATSSRFSQSSQGTSNLDNASNGTSPPTAVSPFPPQGPPPSLPPPSIPDGYRPKTPRTAVARPQEQPTSSPVELVPWKTLLTNDAKVKIPSVFYTDVSSTSATLASKHGNNIIKIWSTASGTVVNTLKVSCYTTAQARSREYFVRSHAILSEPSSMLAIATGFGDTLEIWDWAKKKKLQTIDNADRWASVRSSIYESTWSPLVTYRGTQDIIELYSASHSKKPFSKARVIQLRNAGLPILPKYPELAFSATGPLLVAASGPRPPRPGHPPPKHETLLVAWDVRDDEALGSSAPYKFVTPWQHPELDTALPSGLATYGSVAVSIWIPASYEAVPVPASRGGQGYNLVPVAVRSRHVLVWDFSASSTKTFAIPNVISCVSSDCRFVAYCDTRSVNMGGRGCLVILDAMTGAQLWQWPDPEAGLDALKGSRSGFEQLEDLSKVTDLSFSVDGGFMFVGDVEGGIGVYEVRLKEKEGIRYATVRPGTRG